MACVSVRNVSVLCKCVILSNLQYKKSALSRLLSVSATHYLREGTEMEYMPIALVCSSRSLVKCGMRKVKCGMENAEISVEWWVKCGMRNGKGVTYFALCVAG